MKKLIDILVMIVVFPFYICILYAVGVVGCYFITVFEIEAQTAESPYLFGYM